MKSFVTSLALVLLSALPAAAKDTLTIYTYESFVSEWGPGAAIKLNYEKQCDCTIEWVAVADGVAMLNRLKLEGTATRADIVLGLDTSLTAEANATGLFAPHELLGVAAQTPVSFADPIFVPYDYAHFAVVYDAEKLPVPPKSLDELVSGDPAHKIILQDPRSSTPGLGFLLWMKSVYGDKASAAWEKLAPRILTTTPGWSEAYSLFTKGEAAMVLSYTTSPAYHIEVEKTDKYKAAKFSEGHYLQIEVAGAVAASPELPLARKFLSFMLTPGFQDSIPTANWMLPAGQTSGALPAGFQQMTTPDKTLLFTPEEVNANRRIWIDEWLNATSK
jgi:thiamine transport system substrate-binding protein